ncbi:L-lysine 6-transaminase [Frankia sp. CNm7]|uniref:L-lysine-epsilon aminotransferase n=1 Tax=Frankia nepalensis TaxID=1836974 RepID=A0A937RL44_9ACTN|nr:L-lysine 6-transaminase [Frankia nepalensis]MBL7498538.1 L-lysine 6-transaminase [Frankia nepalensis]MBL7514301.1 L-lysine 6-transaminase [Frankia nepalensis]MBL7522506.1 L-lysine 6-transaminase [Frankia nepalensis]MBL7630895.1 L-lysine 6-transaminase [Frankia nepalensis]
MALPAFAAVTDSQRARRADASTAPAVPGERPEPGDSRDPGARTGERSPRASPTRTVVAPEEVPAVLARHVLVDGLDLVVDLDASRGRTLVDARTGAAYLDLYSFFASAPLGISPPELADDPAVLAELGRAAVNKPANPDVASVAYAEFIATFARVLGDPRLPHLFFVEGGALAVENALKCAFDWKSRHNEAAGRPPALGTRVLHLRHAFHGRGGYTLSVTNTDPVKTARFPTFDWPRVDSPAQAFPVTEASLAVVRAAEARALDQARAAFARYPHDIACFLAEPIQCEGGDRHLRPEFLAAMGELAHAHDALFVLDEVQTGVGATGAPWAYQRLGLTPDVVAFAKKAQVGGVMAGGRVDEVADNVFRVPGRINSTWGGGLVDMVRSTRLLEVMERDRLFEAAARGGERLLAGLVALAEACPGLVSNARGLGLICALDLPDRTRRDETLRRLRVDEHVLALPAGDVTVRLRPALTITDDEIDAALGALGRVLAALADRCA